MGSFAAQQYVLGHRDEIAALVLSQTAAIDLLEPDSISDRCLRSLTSAAAGAPSPIQLGAHTLVGPGIPLLLRGALVRS